MTNQNEDSAHNEKHDRTISEWHNWGGASLPSSGWRLPTSGKWIEVSDGRRFIYTGFPPNDLGSEPLRWRYTDPPQYRWCQASPREYVTQIEHRFAEWPPELRKAAAMLLAPEAFTHADRSVVAGMLVSFAGEISK